MIDRQRTIDHTFFPVHKIDVEIQEIFAFLNLFHFQNTTENDRKFELNEK